MPTSNSRRYKFATIAATATLVATFVMFPTANASASAGTTHKISFHGNSNGTIISYDGLAIEKKASVSYKCDSSTGGYTLTAKNFNVIGSDGRPYQRPLPDWNLNVTVTNPTSTFSATFSVPLLQNPSTELFDAAVTDVTLQETCVSAATVRVYLFDSTDGNLGYYQRGTFR
jgi:hypothetical protein